MQKVGPLFHSLFDIMKDVGKTSNLCKTQAESVFDRVRVRMDHVCIGAVRILESLCCLDVGRFAKPEKPLTGNLPILFVLMLIVMLYNAFVFGYMPAAGIAINSKECLMFHAWIFLTLASFAQAVRTDAGSTPVGARWRNHGNPPQEATERKRGSEEARWCRKSNMYKPDRAHYCRVLKKGVLRMDHFCPWLGNTVGFYNQKYFFLFLLYANAACAQLGITITQFLLEYTLPSLTSFCLIGAESLTLLITTLLVPFFLFHFYLIARNTTTIEFCERMRSRSEEKDDVTDDAPSRYDLGFFRNFQSVLGSNPLLWLIPLSGPPGDGIKFPLNPAYVDFLVRATGMATDADEEAPEEQLAAASDPEATHPEATKLAPRLRSERKLKERAAMGGLADVEEGSEGQKTQSFDRAAEDGLGDIEEGSEGQETQSFEASEEEEETKAEAFSATDCASFLVWMSPAEFLEDLTIGAKYIGEKSVDCGRGSLAYVLTSCVPGTRRIAPPPFRRTSRDYPEGSRRSLRGAPAYQIRAGRAKASSLPDRSSDSDDGKGDTVASASGLGFDRPLHHDFLSD